MLLLDDDGVFRLVISPDDHGAANWLDTAGVADGWGANVSVAHFVNDTWMPFFRAGYADDGGTLLEKSVSVGLGRYMAYRRDLLGLGLNWGEPNEDTFGPGLDNQTTLEIFFRAQVTEWLALTPDFQWLADPALNPEDDSVFLWGIRARAAF